MTTPHDDPFSGSESAPAISFKDEADGAVKKIIADGPARSVQGRDFQTGDPVYWVPGQRGKKSTTPSDNPVMNAVINGVSPDGEPCSLWAQRPSDLYAKLVDAMKAHGPSYRIKAGDEIAVKLVRREPTNGSPKKIHAVKITPGVAPAAPAADPFASNDGFGDQPPF